MSLLNDLESLRIPFGDIKESTKNFTTIIGKGGYGVVYKGELLLSGKLTSVAVKRLDANVSGQGFKEFLTEIQLLTRYKHQNLISLIGFCDQDNEKILIYEYAEHGSLDKYLSTAENRSKLTWKKRINICLNAARGLNYLHNEVATNERVIHRDIKSANVLLDQNWKAMISDLGLSKLGRANEKDTFLITHGYCDPVYISSGILTKESDVYSFGVVLFEVLCGRLGCINVNTEHRFLSTLAQRYCKIGKIEEIMDPALKNQVDSTSVNKFSKIASQCLLNNRKRRPSMRTVVKKLEELEKSMELQSNSNTEMNPMLNPRAAGPEVSLIGIPGSNQGNYSSLLKGWPLTGVDQLRSVMQGSQPFHQPKTLSPQEQQQLLLSQQNKTSREINDESLWLLNNRHMGKEGFSSSVGDIPNLRSLKGVLPRADPDMLLKTQVQQTLQHLEQKYQQYQQQQNMTSKADNDQDRQLRMLGKDGLSTDPDMLLKLKMAQIQQWQQQQNHHSLSGPPPLNLNLNLQQEKVVGASSVGDGSMSNSFSRNDQAGRKRKQPVPSSGPANMAGPSPSSGSSTPLMMFRPDGQTTLTSPLNQLEMA